MISHFLRGTVEILLGQRIVISSEMVGTYLKHVLMVVVKPLQSLAVVCAKPEVETM